VSKATVSNWSLASMITEKLINVIDINGVDVNVVDTNDKFVSSVNKI